MMPSRFHETQKRGSTLLSSCRAVPTGIFMHHACTQMQESVLGELRHNIDARSFCVRFEGSVKTGSGLFVIIVEEISRECSVASRESGGGQRQHLTRLCKGQRSKQIL